MRSYASGQETVEKYTGKEFDNDSGEKMYYFACPPKCFLRRRGTRYLSAELGRWMTVDPLAAKYPSWSPYVYVNCNPLNMIDPTGMSGEDVKDNILVMGLSLTATSVIGGNAEIYVAYKLKTMSLKVGIKGGKSFGTPYLSASGEVSYYHNMNWQTFEGVNSEFDDKFIDNQNPKEVELSAPLIGITADIDNNGNVVGIGVQAGAETPAGAINSVDFNITSPEMKPPEKLPEEKKAEGLLNFIREIFN